MKMHLDRLWFGIPFLLIVLSLASALTSRKILNARGANPMIVDRTQNPAAYWGQVSLRVGFTVVAGLMAAAVIFHTT